ncbi:DUF4352 domain-containing protein [Streptomyces sp. NPDC058685]|uniref:DUF4352 domain-containing protein n=1 Tax=Streptomyces sp. NPDC058685 TaxID=3346598 RepID=UPI00365A2AFB
MSHQYPGPQQPYQGGPAPYMPPPPPKKGMSGLAITGIVLGGIFALIVVVGFIGAAAGGGNDSSIDSKGSADRTSSAPEAAPAERPAAKPAEKKEAPAAPVKVTAEKTTFAPGVLHDGGAYTSVRVTIMNNSDKKISVNPLYFTITDTNGTKHTAELAVDENQIDTVDLAPGENISGAVTGKGSFTAKYVTYVDGLLGEGVRGNVS